MRNAIPILLITTVTIVLAGCGSNMRGNERDRRVLAQINNYKLTVSDFEEEASRALGNKPVSSDAEKSKRAILDEMITKKALLQEVQNQNFDKNSVFMKEIVKYWEQELWN